MTVSSISRRIASSHSIECAANLRALAVLPPGFNEGYKRMIKVDEKTDKKTLPTVKFNKAKAASASDNAKIAMRKALTTDQKNSNAIFSREFRRRWKEAAVKVYRMAKKEFDEEKPSSLEVQKEEAKEAEDAERAALGDGEEKQDEGGEQKEGDDEQQNNSPSDDDEGFDDDDVFKAMQMTADSFERKVSLASWRSFLHRHSIKVLEKMIEEDEDLAKEKRQKEEKDKLKEAKKSYEGFVRRKDECRIRMPTEPKRVVGGHWNPPRMDFSKEGVMRKKQSAIPLNTVQMMRGSGLKYVHAVGKGRVLKADLEGCQKELLETGHVFKENFKPDSKADLGDYEEEKKRNRALKIKRAAEKSREEGCKKSFNLWRAKKEMSEKATELLSENCIDRPSLLAKCEGVENAEKHWIEVGKNLKMIDRNLYKVWHDWTDGFQSSYKCQVLWDFFPPRCCDLHSTAYSGTRDTFLKLLRPNLNYKKVFESQCRKKWNSWEKFCEEKDKDFNEFVAEKLDVETGIRKEEALEKMKLNDRDMRVVMKNLGLKLDGEEMRSESKNSTRM